MSAAKQLDKYLEAFSQRLKKLTIIQGIAATACVLLLASVIGAYFSTESGYASNTIIGFRIFLILALAVVIVRFITQPLKRIKHGISTQVESRSPGFQGRIETYSEMKQDNNPFHDLLAEDALRVSEAYPVEQQIAQKDLNIAGAITATAAAILIYLLIAGPGMLNYSLRNLFAGWAIDDLLPPQSIVVSPGDQSVRRGANIRISTIMDGFNPDEAIIYVQSGDNEWQDVKMVQGLNGFEFTFFSLQEDMSYYVSTTGIRSPEFEIQVVDVPAIEKLSLTYHYPEWTKRESETFERGGDIRTLADTRVVLTVTTTSPLIEGELVLNSNSQSLSLNGNEATTNFTVTEEGEYFIAAIVGGEQVRLSDDYFIRLTEDGKPVIEIPRPGGDWNASNIEEVLVRVEASDDYGLETVELKYSVNAGEWLTIDMSENSRNVVDEHIFMLEDMVNEVTREVEATEIGAFNIVFNDDPDTVDIDESFQIGEAIAEPEPVFETEQLPLQPGDIISFYALASDRTQSIRTDMFFIQVQPFNRRYSQSQLSGGGGGGGGPQDEISNRQKQIIVSSWNLVRKQAENSESGTIEVNSFLLSELQITLAEQAQTLARRAKARQLNRDEQIESFVEYLERAVQSMYPASQRLAEVDLEGAIQPAQEALQYLLRAESVFNDITISQQQGGGGGGGGRSGQDLAEMFELEMDLKKNQYETGNNASPQSQAEEAEDIMNQLDELARRQEQLANNMRNQQQISEAQRYQQEMLRRETEQLQERLERMQQQNQSGQQQANSQQGQQQGQQGEGQGQSGQGQQVAQSELQRRLESAIRAMNETTEAMRGNPGAQELQRAVDEAQRQLEGARDQVAQEQLASMQQSFSNMATQSESMLREQRRMERQLQAAMEKAVAERQSGEDPNSRGMELQEEWALAREKQELVSELQSLQQEMLSSMQLFQDEVPNATRELQLANRELTESELEQMLSDAALYIDSGYGLYIAGNESIVTAAMRDLAENLERAQEMAAGAGVPGNTDLDRARRQAQDLRSQLQEQLAQGGQPGQGQAGGGGDRFGGIGPRGGWAAFNGLDLNEPINLPAGFFGNVEDLTRLLRAAIPQLDLNTEELAEMYDLIRELEFTRVNRNDSILAQEYNEMLALIEQLEVNLQLDTSGNNPNNVRTAVTDVIPDEYKDAVAEYYRRLSRE